MSTVTLDNLPLQSLVTSFGIRCDVDTANPGTGATFKYLNHQIVLSRRSTPYIWFHELGHVLDKYVNFADIVSESYEANNIYYNMRTNDHWFEDYCKVPCETVANQVAMFLCNTFGLPLENDEKLASSFPPTEASKKRIDNLIQYLLPLLPSSVTAFNRAEDLVKV